MKMWSIARGRGHAVSAVLSLLLASPPASAQLIGVRTVPVASGDQFVIHPSERMGMAQPSIVLHDRLLDPWVNPAKGSLVEESSFLGAPSFYDISGNAGAGRTLPLSGLFAGDVWFGGVGVALQQIVDEPGWESGIFWAQDAIWRGPPRRLGETSSRNLYVDGFVGRRIPGTNLSFGGSLSWSDLNAVDGVDLLYQASDGVDQNGDIFDARVGLFSEDEEGRSFELLLLHNRRSMTHDVRNIEWNWLNPLQRWEITTVVETNLDETHTWGVHSGYVAPITESGWRLGGILTVNRKTHPKIPNYEIQNIPRDPGETMAWNMGVGLARESGPISFGVDIVYEPVWSDTWQEADSLIPLPGGGRIEVGERTIENDFFFSNIGLRFGLARETDRWGFQVGVQVRSYDYDLVQFDNVESTRRKQSESWEEWAPSVGVVWKLDELELRYAGRMTSGTGRPGTDFTGDRAVALAESDFIVAPQGPLTLQEAHVLTHQLSIRLPIR